MNKKKKKRKKKYNDPVTREKENLSAREKRTTLAAGDYIIKWGNSRARHFSLSLSPRVISLSPCSVVECV